MCELDVSLDFACDACNNGVQAKLKCSGEGVTGGCHAVAAVDLTCPNCQAINQVIFELSGYVLRVESEQYSFYLEPSLN
jgi:hypothetical protein